MNVLPGKEWDCVEKILTTDTVLILVDFAVSYFLFCNTDGLAKPYLLETTMHGRKLMVKQLFTECFM